MRDPAEITRTSAVNIAKWRIQDMLDTDKSLSMMQAFALRTALADGGAIEQIADILYDCGLKITVDKNNPTHQDWLTPDEKGDAAVYLEKV